MAPFQVGGRHAGKLPNLTLGDDLALAAVRELVRRMDNEMPCGCPKDSTVCLAGSFDACGKRQHEAMKRDTEA